MEYNLWPFDIKKNFAIKENCFREMAVRSIKIFQNFVDENSTKYNLINFVVKFSKIGVFDWLIIP